MFAVPPHKVRYALPLTQSDLQRVLVWCTVLYSLIINDAHSCSAVFHAFLSGTARVLDRNIALGSQLLPLALSVLQFAPSPQRYASDTQPPNYSLHLLEGLSRPAWLQILLVILYKVLHPLTSLAQYLNFEGSTFPNERQRKSEMVHDPYNWSNFFQRLWFR